MTRDADWPAAVLFDLDGTLIDSAGDLCASVNALLARDGLGPLALAQVKAMIGHGLRKLVERAYRAAGRPLADADLDRRYDAVLEIYAANLAVHTVLMPGAREALGALAKTGAPLGLVTNKPQRATEALLAHFGMAGAFRAVIGGDAGFAAKPAPDILLAAAARLGVDPRAALLVGDGPADAEGARAAGMPAVLVEGGYSNAPLATLGADAVIASLAELPGAIERLRET